MKKGNIDKDSKASCNSAPQINLFMKIVMIKDFNIEIKLPKIQNNSSKKKIKIIIKSKIDI